MKHIGVRQLPENSRQEANFVMRSKMIPNVCNEI
jgi:hypothetical protein